MSQYRVEIALLLIILAVALISGAWSKTLPMVILWTWVAATRAIRRPESFTYKGKTFVRGVDYHDDHDKELILRYGVTGLNFDPRTPPEYR